MAYFDIIEPKCMYPYHYIANFFSLVLPNSFKKRKSPILLLTFSSKIYIIQYTIFSCSDSYVMVLLMKLNYFLVKCSDTKVNILYLRHIDLVKAIKTYNIVVFFLKNELQRLIYFSLVNLVWMRLEIIFS